MTSELGEVSSPKAGRVDPAAINLEKIYAWLKEIPLAKSRISHCQKLANQHLAIA